MSRAENSARLNCLSMDPHNSFVDAMNQAWFMTSTLREFGYLLIEGGSASSLMPRSLFGAAPITTSSKPPFAISSCFK